MSSVLGLSHLCVGGTGRMATTVKNLANLGYTVQFSLFGQKNPKEKKSFVRIWTEKHDIIFLSHPTLPSIELLHHHNLAMDNPSNYTLLFSPASITTGPTPHLDSLGIHIESRCTNSPERLTIQTSSTKFTQAHSFWSQALGFSATSAPFCKDTLEFNALSTTWSCQLNLHKEHDSTSSLYLDDTGCTCLSFLTTNIDDTLAQCEHHGATDIGEVFNLTVKEKTVRVAFIRGPHGELIELLQFT